MTSSPSERLHEAAAFLQRGDPARALMLAEAANRDDPEDAEALHLIALSLSRMGDRDRAAAAFEKAAAMHPRKDIVLVNLGNHWRRAGRLDAAVEAYRRAVAVSPASVDALNALGNALAAGDDRSGAAAAYRQALGAQPQSPAAHIGLGNVSAARGRFSDAVEHFTSALRAAPGSAAALVNRGAALRRLGRLADSLADLDRAIALAPSLVEAHFQRAATLRTTARFEEAAGAYRKALSIAPSRADIHREYAGMMFEIGRLEQAFALLDAAFAAQPSAALMTLRGDLALLFGDVGAARDAAARSLASAPDDAQALGLAARAARQAGAMERALADARRAAEKAPDDFPLLHLCCEIELAAGHAAEAAKRLAGDAPLAHLQKHVALRATAMRASGDPDYRLYYDYDRLTAQNEIAPPKGYPTIAAFNAALRAAIAPLHQTKQRPLEQTLYGGTQSPGRLWNEDHPVIRLYAETMLAAARDFVARLPDDASHPFLSRKTPDLDCAGAWSVILASGGGHVDHIHPAGWISACYYVESPDEIFSGDRAGFLRLGASGVPGLSLPAERYFPPRPGTVVFFPSYIWHGVEPFSAASPRITAPFDLAPALD